MNLPRGPFLYVTSRLSGDSTPLDINWFIGEQVPVVIEEILEDDSESEDELENEEDDSDSKIDDDV